MKEHVKQTAEPLLPFPPEGRKQARYAPGRRLHTCIKYLLLCICLGTWGVQQLYAQQVPIRLRCSHQPLRSILDTLEQRYQLVFAYDEQLLDGIELTADLHATSLRQALTSLLKDTNLEFEIVGREYIILKARPAPPPPAVPVYSGTVWDSLSQQPLAYAQVFHPRLKQGTLTDESGHFQLPLPLQGQDSIWVSHIGYERKSLLLKPISQTVTVTLRPRLHTLEDVMIAAKKITPISIPSGQNYISVRPNDIEAFPGLGEPDLLRGLQLLPGVSGQDEGTGGLHVRGGTPDQNLVLWDGIPVFHRGHFFGAFSPFNPQAVQDLNFYAGGLSAQYGGRVASLMEMKLKPDSIDRFRFHAGINLLHTNLYTQLPMFRKKAALIVGLRSSYADLAPSSFYKKWFDVIFQQGKIQQAKEGKQRGADFVLSPLVAFSDFNLRWLLRPSSKHELALSLYSASDQLDYYLSDLSTHQFTLNTLDKINQSNVGMSLNWWHHPHRQYRSHTTLALSSYQHQYLYEMEVPLPDFMYHATYSQTNNLQELSIKNRHEWEFVPGHRLLMGGEVAYGFADLVNRSAENDSLQNEETSTFNSPWLATYAEYDFQAGRKFHIRAGLRHLYFGSIDSSFLEPRLAIDYRPHPRLQLRVAWGHYHQSLSQVVFHNPLGVGEAFWVLTDQEKVVVNSRQWNLGLDLNMGHTQLKVDAYHRRVTGLLSFTLAYDRELDQPTRELPLEPGESRVEGVELLLRQQWGAYRQWLGYTLSRVRYRFRRINEGRPFFAPHDQRHSIKWTHLLALGDWEFAASWMLHTGRPYTRAKAVVQNENPNEVPFYIELDHPNGARLPAYHRLDVAGSYTFPLGRRQKWRGKAGLSVYNLYNRANVQGKRYLIDFPQSAGQAPGILRLNRYALGLTPNVFIAFDW